VSADLPAQVTEADVELVLLAGLSAAGHRTPVCGGTTLRKSNGYWNNRRTSKQSVQTLHSLWEGFKLMTVTFNIS